MILGNLIIASHHWPIIHLDWASIIFHTVIFTWGYHWGKADGRRFSK